VRTSNPTKKELKSEPRLDSLQYNLVIGSYESLTLGAEPFLRSFQMCSYSKTSQHFMEHEGSLPCSQEPSTGPYPEPVQSNHTILVKGSYEYRNELSGVINGFNFLEQLRNSEGFFSKDIQMYVSETNFKYFQRYYQGAGTAQSV
jgi:hypothetical protein